MTDTLTIPQADATAYVANHEGASVSDGGACGRIWMRNRDAAALLHRLSTNQIEKLTRGQGTRTVLTSPIGRIIDLLTVHRTSDGLLLVTSPGNGPAIMARLRKNIFFNDKVDLDDASTRMGQLLISGPRAVDLLVGLGLPAAELPPYGITSATWQDWSLYLTAITPFAGAGYALYPPIEALPALRDALRDAGAVTLDPATYEVLRVEAGEGAFGRELSQEYIPLETGLWDVVSFTKGCYVGQEIIARMESRKRLARQLRGLRWLDGLPAPIALPSTIVVDGKDAGDLTSLARSPRYGMIGLAYVRSIYAEPGTVLEVGGAAAQVVGLPFV